MKYIIFLFLLFLSACSSSSQNKNYAQLASLTEGFKAHSISTLSFTLMSYERLQQSNEIANIYIEGDGRAWIDRETPSPDPTPYNPLALKLAKQDMNNNVIYLARPCQYMNLTGDRSCSSKYWTSHRYAEEVVRAMDMALDDIKRRHQFKKFNLVGFSGGANIAALLAARRNDIVSIRTVAGNLDHVTLHKTHNVSQIPASLNAVDIASQINIIPQHHFIGMQDTIVTPEIIKSYLTASGNASCVQASIIENADHHSGWVSIWPDLLEYPLICRGAK